MNLPSTLLTLFLLLAATAASAGEFNAKLNIGDQAPVWRDLPGVDGKRHSLTELKHAGLVAVVFTCNSCDVAAGYEDRIIDFARRREGEVVVVAICVSTKPQDSLEAMRDRAKEKEYPFAYLFDKSQQIGRAYGASYTPEFFLLDADRQVVYMGSLDDSTYADRVTKKYLDDAVDAVLAGETPAMAETAPRGCRIRYPRTRPSAEPTKAESVLIDEQEVRDRVRRNPPPTFNE